MNTILFPTDFSDSARNAFTYALHLADKINASITTLHVERYADLDALHLPSTAKRLQELIQNDDLETYRAEAKLMHEEAAKEFLQKVELTHLLKSGEIVDTILKTAKEENADMIVMGTKGASGLKEIFMGSVASNVIEDSPIPVLAVPDEASFSSIDKIAYATNLEYLEESILQQAVDFATLFGAEVRIIHINVSHTNYADEKMDKWRERFKHRRNVSFEVVPGTDILKGITKYVEDNDIDILAMLTHRRTFYQKIFTVNYTEKVCLHTDVPLVAFSN